VQALVVDLLVNQTAVLQELLAVIRGDHHDGVVGEARGVEALEEYPQDIVDVPDAGVIQGLEVGHGVVRQGTRSTPVEARQIGAGGQEGLHGPGCLGPAARGPVDRLLGIGELDRSEVRVGEPQSLPFGDDVARPEQGSVRNRRVVRVVHGVGVQEQEETFLLTDAAEKVQAPRKGGLDVVAELRGRVVEAFEAA